MPRLLFLSLVVFCTLFAVASASSRCSAKNGECMEMTSCRSSNTLSGLCPGPASIKCCLRSSSSSSSSSSYAGNSVRGKGWVKPSGSNAFDLGSPRSDSDYSDSSKSNSKAEWDHGSGAQWVVPSFIRDADKWNRYLSETAGMCRPGDLACIIPRPMSKFTNVHGKTYTIRKPMSFDFNPNAHVKQASNDFMLEKLGNPRCQAPGYHWNEARTRRYCTVENTCGCDVAPGLRKQMKSHRLSFHGVTHKLSGLAPFVDILVEVFTQVAELKPHLWKQVKFAGMICCRQVRRPDGTISPDAFSNHSRGTAVDMYFGKFARRKTERGMAELAPFFTNKGIYVMMDDDSMHFEASRTLIEQWLSEGRIHKV